MVDIKMIGSTFGGGWALPVTEQGWDAGGEVFECDPREWPPLGGEPGWIVEPQDAVDVVGALVRLGASVELPNGIVLP